jgi:hypothetical protein
MFKAKGAQHSHRRLAASLPEGRCRSAWPSLASLKRFRSARAGGESARPHRGLLARGDVSEEHQVALDGRELGNEAVVHEQPASVTERVTIRLLDGRADRRADVREEQGRGGMTRKLAEVLVVLGRLDAVEHARLGHRVVPADAESIAVRRLGSQRRVQTLIDQRTSCESSSAARSAATAALGRTDQRRRGVDEEHA